MSNVLDWRKSLRCASSACVEFAAEPGVAYVRDSKHPAAPFLTFTAADWNAFLGGLKTGRV